MIAAFLEKRWRRRNAALSEGGIKDRHSGIKTAAGRMFVPAHAGSKRMKEGEREHKAYKMAAVFPI